MRWDDTQKGIDMVVHTFKTEKNSITSAMNDALAEAYKVHEEGKRVSSIIVDIKNGLFHVITLG